jgi:hypothetical protein
MPAQTSLVDVDRGDYIEHVYSFDNATTRSIFEAKAGVQSRDSDALNGKLIAALALLEQADTNWAGLTAGQKDNAARLVVRVCAALIRKELNS